MGARRIPNATNEKIIALMSMGKTGEQTAFAVGVRGRRERELLQQTVQCGKAHCQ